jgi:diguanylate cyclase (GGDEF)-like protein
MSALLPSDSGIVFFLDAYPICGTKENANLGIWFCTAHFKKGRLSMPLSKSDPALSDPLSKTSLLFVEDDRVTREQAARLLERKLGRVLTACDGSEGLRVFRKERPDIVLADITMPVMDGLAMAAIIKSESPDTPIIAVTAHEDEHSLQQALDVGMDGYVIKPLDLDAMTPVLFKNARLVMQRRREEARRQLFTYLLDINPHLIVSSSRDAVDYANRTFLTFVGQESLDSLLAGAPGLLSEVHVGGARYALDDFSWITALPGLAEHQRTACFSASGEACAQENTFWITTRHFRELDRVVVTFTDITPLERERVQLLYQATTDSLTGVANRYKLTEYIASEHARFRRYGLPLTLIMFDIDHFKQVNDTHGHPAGDTVLAELAGMVLRAVRDTDILGRWGGEEFMLLAPISTKDDGLEFAERLRAMVESAAFPGDIRITVSFGVAELAPDESVDSLLRRVDEALYKAKRNGRNRVETA